MYWFVYHHELGIAATLGINNAFPLYMLNAKGIERQRKEGENRDNNKKAQKPEMQ